MFNFLVHEYLSCRMKQKHSPIKRHTALQAISRDHHHILMLCWKIRIGFRKGISSERMKAYALWFYRERLLRHFEIEESRIFSLIGKEHQLVKKALSERRKLHKLFQFKEDAEICLSLIEEKLEAHIRFEERVLLNEIQNRFSDDTLNQLNLQNAIPPFCDNESDLFWN